VILLCFTNVCFFRSNFVPKKSWWETPSHPKQTWFPKDAGASHAYLPSWFWGAVWRNHYFFFGRCHVGSLNYGNPNMVRSGTKLYIYICITLHSYIWYIYIYDIYIYTYHVHLYIISCSFIWEIEWFKTRVWWCQRWLFSIPYAFLLWWARTDPNVGVETTKPPSNVQYLSCEMDAQQKKSVGLYTLTLKVDMGVGQ